VAGSEDVLITFTKDAYKLPARLPAPGFRRSLEELRFLKKDLERLAGKLKHEARPAQQQTQIQGRPQPISRRADTRFEADFAARRVAGDRARLLEACSNRALDEHWTFMR